MNQKSSESVTSEQELSFMIEFDMRSDILEIKAKVEERRLKPKQIMVLLEKAGEFSSESSIRRVLKPGSEDKTFNYDLSIRPLKKVLCGDGDLAEIDSITAQARIEGLEAVCTRQEELIEVLRDQIAQIKQDHARICAQYEDAIALCKEQIAIKDTRMERKDGWIESQRKQNMELTEKVEMLMKELHGKSEGNDD